MWMYWWRWGFLINVENFGVFCYLGEDASLPITSGGSYQVLVNNVFYFTQRVVDKLWQGMFNKESKLLVDFIIQLIAQVTGLLYYPAWKIMFAGCVEMHGMMSLNSLHVWVSTEICFSFSGSLSLYGAFLAHLPVKSNWVRTALRSHYFLEIPQNKQWNRPLINFEKLPKFTLTFLGSSLTNFSWRVLEDLLLAIRSIVIDVKILSV